MSDSKMGGIVTLGAIFLVASAYSSKTPQPPEICHVPQLDGSVMDVQVSTIPCDQLVRDAQAAMNAARQIVIPERLTIQAPADASPAAAAAPIGEISQEEEQKFNTPYEPGQNAVIETPPKVKDETQQ
ncbi:hypothetical protein [Undibacterium pigrum]|uniref:Uncharacterized protein n=1 Tax=Undibacterium pigrum TaxID=401470 RepID=A0A318JM57_9BURK|nr:hypothetical protein [Undibacterium pigrum]PXX41352.1 hypothetical protein DFR42_1073 [Undibacterium pigrum]